VRPKHADSEWIARFALAAVGCLLLGEFGLSRAGAP